MSYSAFVRVLFLLMATALMPIASAGDDPVHERHELMEEVGDAAKPVGEFNKAGIVARGTKFEHWLNGKKVLEVDTASPEWAAANWPSATAAIASYRIIA